MTASTPLVIWGASGHAAVVADVVRLQGQYEIVGFRGDPPQRHPALGAPVIGGSAMDDEPRGRGVAHVLIAVGDCSARLRLARRAVELGYQLAAAIHPRAVVASSASIGGGTVIMAGAVVNPGAIVGPNCIINTCASVDHDCTLAAGVHICPGAHLAGNVNVGEGTTIGVGSAVREGIRIGAGCVIGAGAAVVRDIPDHALAMGVPARVVRLLR
jgi:sugar O-acyltransferase (sialic acid O-acetyltransferase NeuD family)